VVDLLICKWYTDEPVHIGVQCASPSLLVGLAICNFGAWRAAEVASLRGQSGREVCSSCLWDTRNAIEYHAPKAFCTGFSLTRHMRGHWPVVIANGMASKRKGEKS